MKPTNLAFGALATLVLLKNLRSGSLDQSRCGYGENQRLRPLFGFFGSKWNLAPEYPNPWYDTIIEPFAGSANYALYHFQKNIILVEKNKKLSDLWEWLIKTPRDQILALPLFSPKMLLDAKDKVKPINLDAWPDLQNYIQKYQAPEARTLIGLWTSRSPATIKASLTPWGIKYLTDPKTSHQILFWNKQVRRRIADEVGCIRHWKVYNMSYSKFPNTQKPATWFVDPPYQHKGTHYTWGSKELDFGHLAQWCKTRAGQVIVAEGMDLMDGVPIPGKVPDWLPFKALKDLSTLHTRRTRSKKGYRQLIWLNTDPDNKEF